MCLCSSFNIVVTFIIFMFHLNGYSKSSREKERLRVRVIRWKKVATHYSCLWRETIESKCQDEQNFPEQSNFSFEHLLHSSRLIRGIVCDIFVSKWTSRSLETNLSLLNNALFYLKIELEFELQLFLANKQNDNLWQRERRMNSNWICRELKIDLSV